MESRIWVTILCSLIPLSGAGMASAKTMGVTPSPVEQKLTRNWLESHLQNEAFPLFSVKLDGQALATQLAGWQVDRQHQRLANQTQQRITYSDPVSRLHIILTITLFQDFPAVEWLLAFENQGEHDTPILEAIQAADLYLFPSTSGAFILHHARGSDHEKDDFAPLRTEITVGQELKFTPVGGRSSDKTAFPFFNLQADNGGVMIAIGWSGQWQATFTNDPRKGIGLRAGMELTHLRLHPGEKIRTPRIMLLFWDGQDRLRGHNLLRQFLLTHHTPQRDGQPVTGPLACGAGSFIFEEYSLATEHAVIALLERYRQFKLQPDYWWIDAGWYGSMEFERGEWHTNVGNWYPKKEHFPNGLRPVADLAKQMGMDLILWFEPERVYRDTWLHREHPDWILKGVGTQKNFVLNLGHPEARKWLTGYISGMITSTKIKIYRQDFNIRPLDFWRSNDAPDRQGLTEIRHIEGLYAFWDELLRRHPGLIIDNCASGGRRLDLETITRSIPLWRTDYDYREPNGRPGHTFGLHFYLPMNGTGSHETELYNCRCCYSSSIVFGWNIYDETFPKDKARYIFQEYKKIQPYFWGDYYPLTEYSTSDRNWIGFQFHRTDLGAGMALLYRRPACENLTQSIVLQGLDETAQYEMSIEDNGVSFLKSGAELMQGLDIRIIERPGSAVLTYRQLR